MQRIQILNNKKTKELLSMIKKQWGADFKTDNAFLKNEKGKIYLVNKDISKLDLHKIKINSLGLYFAQVIGTDIRLSIEGSQLIGPKATKNILELDENQAKEWMQGSDLETQEKTSGFILIKYKNDFLGTGKFREGKVFNYVTKARRVSI